MQYIQRTILVAISVLVLGGCAGNGNILIKNMFEGPAPLDKDLALLVHGTSKLPDGKILTAGVSSVDGMKCPDKYCYAPLRIKPGRHLITGRTETPRRVLFPKIVWEETHFESEFEFIPGGVYKAIPIFDGQSVRVHIQFICKASDHQKTANTIVFQAGIDMPCQ